VADDDTTARQGCLDPRLASPLSRLREEARSWRWTGTAKWTPQDLRPFAACWMLFDLGLDPAVVATMLGHHDPVDHRQALRRRPWGCPDNSCGTH
jgi:integrase